MTNESGIDLEFGAICYVKYLSKISYEQQSAICHFVNQDSFILESNFISTQLKNSDGGLDNTETTEQNKMSFVVIYC